MNKISYYILVFTLGYALCDGRTWMRQEDKPVPSESGEAFMPSEDRPVDKPAEIVPPVDSLPPVESKPPVEDKPPVEAKPPVESAPVESAPANGAPVETQPQTSSEATTTTTAKPPPKTYGCTNPVFSDIKFCWTRCNTASTSSFWNTWCFTTKGGENSTKVECTEDSQCLSEWECKSSCGMFSPHWDKKQENGEPMDAPMDAPMEPMK